MLRQLYTQRKKNCKCYQKLIKTAIPKYACPRYFEGSYLRKQIVYVCLISPLPFKKKKYQNKQTKIMYNNKKKRNKQESDIHLFANLKILSQIIIY